MAQLPEVDRKRTRQEHIDDHNELHRQHDLIDAGESLSLFSASGNLTVRAGVGRLMWPFPIEVVGVSSALGTAPTGSAAVFDLNRNGITMFTTQANRPAVAAGLNASDGEALPDVVAVDVSDYVTVDIDQIGSIAPGAELTMVVRYRRAP